MTNLEELSPSEFSNELRMRVSQLNAVIDLKLKALKRAPVGTLNISECRGHTQYYHRTSSDSTKGKYITKDKIALSRSLAQKDYDARVLKALKKEFRILNEALAQLDEVQKTGNNISNIFQNLSLQRRALISPVTLTDEQYAAAWLAQKYEGKTFQTDAPEYYTARGERVRSKSEIIIADTLARFNVPYRYEYPLTLNSNHHSKITIYPDFLCLNLRTRQEFIWEHFGRMDDPEYSAKTVQKLNTYTENKIFPSKNLIITTETASLPLNAKHLELIIKEYLK